MNRTHKHFKSQSGFTLLEALVALALSLGLLLLGSMAITKTSRQASQLVEQRDTDDTKAHVSHNISSSFINAGRHLTLTSPTHATATSYSDEVLRDAPILWWRLDEQAATTIGDSSGNNNDGILSGNYDSSEAGALNSESDRSTRLNGGAQGRISHNGPLTPASSFTVEWWINPASATNYNQLIRTDGLPGYAPPDGSWFFGTTSTRSLYCGTSLANAFSPTDIPDETIKLGEWQHLAYTYDGSTGTLYLNGRRLGTKLQPPPSNWSIFSLTDIDGLIDEVALYHSALSSERVKSHYIAGIAPPVPENTTGVLSPMLPLAKWKSDTFETIDGPVSVSPDNSRALLLSGDDNFSPTQLQANYVGNDPSQTSIITRKGVRAAPEPGDYLLLIDYSLQTTLLVTVTGEITEIASPLNSSDVAWAIPVRPVCTDGSEAPAWGVLQSRSSEASSIMAEGASVVRLSPPTIYYREGDRLVRAYGDTQQTLALGASLFTITRNAGASTTSWTVSFEISGEGIESSNDPLWNQRASAALTLAPTALNPGQ
jgi:type II secretory pathway pseudopilin PulG